MNVAIGYSKNSAWDKLKNKQTRILDDEPKAAISASLTCDWWKRVIMPTARTGGKPGTRARFAYCKAA